MNRLEKTPQAENSNNPTHLNDPVATDAPASADPSTSSQNHAPVSDGDLQSGGQTPPAGNTQKSRSRRFSFTVSTKEVILGAVGIIGLILVWELVSQTGMVSPRAVPPPTDVAQAAANIVMGANFWSALWASVWATLIGMVVICAIAIPLSIAIHSSRVVDESTWFLIEFLKPIPGVALIPLALLIWGPTDGVKIVLIVFGALWPLLTQLVYGLREISGVALSMAKVYRLSPWQRFKNLTIPSMMPFALTGLRISVTIALIVAIVTEYIVGIPGLGQMLAFAQLNGAIAQSYALLFFSGVLGLLFSGAVTALNGPLLFWHPSQHERRGS